MVLSESRPSFYHDVAELFWFFHEIHANLARWRPVNLRSRQTRDSDSTDQDLPGVEEGKKEKGGAETLKERKDGWRCGVADAASKRRQDPCVKHQRNLITEGTEPTYSHQFFHFFLSSSFNPFLLISPVLSNSLPLLLNLTFQWFPFLPNLKLTIFFLSFEP